MSKMERIRIRVAIAATNFTTGQSPSSSAAVDVWHSGELPHGLRPEDIAKVVAKAIEDVAHELKLRIAVVD